MRQWDSQGTRSASFFACPADWRGFGQRFNDRALPSAVPSSNSWRLGCSWCRWRLGSARCLRRPRSFGGCCGIELRLISIEILDAVIQFCTAIRADLVNWFASLAAAGAFLHLNLCWSEAHDPALSSSSSCAAYAFDMDAVERERSPAPF